MDQGEALEVIDMAFGRVTSDRPVQRGRSGGIQGHWHTGFKISLLERIRGLLWRIVFVIGGQ